MSFNLSTTPPALGTSAWRILHEVKSGIWIDNFDGAWWVQTQTDHYPESLKSLHSQAKSIYWRPRDAAASTSANYIVGKKLDSQFEVEENGALFKIDFSAGYSPGIFLDQRENRKRVFDRTLPGQKILNTFAYTGAFSVMAALAGAETTTLDLSKTYLDWTWENFGLNKLDSKNHHGCKGDAFEWLSTFKRQGRHFDGVILDPPTFSRHKKKTFKTDRDYAELVELAAAVTEPGGWILCCANTHRLGIRDYQRQVEQGIRNAGRRVLNCEKTPMPPEFHGDDYLKSLWVDVG